VGKNYKVRICDFNKLGLLGLIICSIALRSLSLIGHTSGFSNL